MTTLNITLDEHIKLNSKLHFSNIDNLIDFLYKIKLNKKEKFSILDFQIELFSKEEEKKINSLSWVKKLRSAIKKLNK
jgi:hypothetical protein